MAPPKVYADILGRNYKTEILNWDSSVYTTTLQSFNGRDQVTKTKQYQGSAPVFGGNIVPESLICPNGTCQEVSMTYDGHGRMKTRRFPIEDVGTNTVWEYNADDAMQTVTDPRGVLRHFVDGFAKLQVENYINKAVFFLTVPYSVGVTQLKHCWHSFVEKKERLLALILDFLPIHTPKQLQ